MYHENTAELMKESDGNKFDGAEVTYIITLMKH